MDTRLFSLAAALLMACSSTPADEQVKMDMGSTSLADVGAAEDLGGAPDTRAGGSADDGGEDVGALVDLGTDAGTTNPSAVYRGEGDPYLPGALSVTNASVGEGEGGAPVAFELFSPTTSGVYPVVVFQHGFVLRNSYYSDMLEHVASHGFVVVAPQMYEPSFFGAPSAAEEAAGAVVLYEWLRGSLGDVLDVDIDGDALGLAGHSRGAKVIWLALESGFTGAVAAAGVDPVDGAGGPLGNEPRVLEAGLATNIPSLFIGTELGADLVFGMACAPVGDNYQSFYDAASAPAFWVFAEGYGHLDLLNDETPGCGLTCSGCVDGPNDGAFRRFAAGQLVALFRWQLQGVSDAADFLAMALGAPLTAQFQGKWP